MGYRELILELPTNYSEEMLREKVSAVLDIRDFTCTVGAKSLDARKKTHIHWRIQVGISSAELTGGTPEAVPQLNIPRLQRPGKVLVVGSGPAGIFAAMVLQQAGFQTTLIERGTQVAKRAAAINRFETTAAFDPVSNYAFGEGGAGTFSDGKLTARTKNITCEKNYIIERYIAAGGPPEIAYLAHPHLGTDHLRHIVVNLRREFERLGGTMLFETTATDLQLKGDTVVAIDTTRGQFTADGVIIAPGHSAYETYRMLAKRGVAFRTKSFALGCRVEHPQELINIAQWGRPSLPGVKAAEYRLTASCDGSLPVFTFCMCPGGMVVPATAYAQANIVNGMSRFRRDGRFANAACVAAINLNELLGRQIEPLAALDWLEQLEQSFYRFSGDYRAPFAPISDFISGKSSSAQPESSYPLGLVAAPLREMLPIRVSESLANGLAIFARKLKGFDQGIIMGLESKTSSPLQVLRDERRCCQGFSNLYLAGEGSGWSGGIVSSGVDGIRTAMALIRNTVGV